MSGGFADSPRKRVVRERYNTRLLRCVSEQLQAKYVYLGLPGRDILDIREWADMIRRVIAFEVLDNRLSNPRANIEEMTANLIASRIPNSIYCGYIENTVILGRDDDNTAFAQDELVTLYNLDFCNRITGMVPTPDRTTGKCLRFEALRALLRLQRERYDENGESRFIMLLTVLDGFTLAQMHPFLDYADKPSYVAEWLDRAMHVQPLTGKKTQRHTPILKAFVFSMFRTYCRGLNVATHFLPMVQYEGKTTTSRMVHFPILCRFVGTESAVPKDKQSAKDFLRHRSLRATDTDLVVDSLPHLEETGGVPDVEAAVAAFYAQ